MKELNKLVIQYKKTKNSQILNQIFEILKNVIKKKAEFIFYQKTFKFGKCEFRLINTKQIELNDVKQELNLEVLRIINNYNIKKPFEKYLFGCLWNWKPKFMNKKFLQQYLNIHETDGNRGIKIDEILGKPEGDKEKINIDEMFENLTKIEKKIINFLIKNSNLNQSQLAEKIGVTQQMISKIMKNVRKKYRKRL